MAKKIIHIHGFMSSGESFKARLLRRFFGDENVLSPTLPEEPFEVIKYLRQLFDNQDIAVISGSSLGGFYALYFHSIYKKPAVLINPSLKPYETLKDIEGTFERYYTGEPFVWKKQYTDELKQIKNELDKNTIDQSKLYFYLSTDDEVLDHSQIPLMFPKANIKFFDGAKHAFTKFAQIIPEIKEIWNKQQ